jgi:hypothetical protein
MLLYMEINIKIGMMQTVGDRSIMLFGVVSIEKIQKSSYFYNGSTL